MVGNWVAWRAVRSAAMMVEPTVALTAAYLVAPSVETRAGWRVDRSAEHLVAPSADC